MKWPLELVRADPEFIVLALLLAAHLLVDFFIRAERLEDSKADGFWKLVLHSVVFFVVLVLLLLPFRCIDLVKWAAALAFSHVLIDAGISISEKNNGRPLRHFLLDQVLHMTAIIVLWRVLVSLNMNINGNAVAWIGNYAAAWLVVAGFAFNGSGGTAIVRKLLQRYPRILPRMKGESGEPDLSMGRTIGNLERALLYILVLLGQWGALGFVLAAKSIARFKELERQDFADYYLIGTLGSVLAAIASGLVISGFLKI